MSICLEKKINAQSNQYNKSVFTQNYGNTTPGYREAFLEEDTLEGLGVRQMKRVRV